MQLKIGVQNFRVFKEMTDFEIRPLTLLIGPNNSGKSSFTKLLMLLKNGIIKLNFDNGNHNLKSFKDSQSWGNKRKSMCLKLPNGISWLSDDFHVELYYLSASIIGQIIIKNNNDDVLLKIKIPETIKKGTPLRVKDLLNKELTMEDIVFTEYGEHVLSVNIDLIIQMIYAKTITYFAYDDNYVKQGKKQIEDVFNDSKDDLSELKFSNLFEKNKNNHLDWRFGISEPGIAAILSNEIDEVNQDGLLYQLYIDDIHIDKESSKENIRKCQTLFFNTFLIKDIKEAFDNPDYYDMDAGDQLDALKGVLPKMNYIVKNKIKEFFAEELSVPSEKIEIKETDLGNLVFGKHKTPKLPHSKNYYYVFFEQLGNIVDASLFDDLNYVGANRGNKEQIIYDRDNLEVNEIYANFFENFQTKNSYKDYKNYINESLNIFGIKGKIVVERALGATSVFVEYDDKTKGIDGKVELSKLGFGFSQIIPVILKFLTSKSGSRQGDIEFNLDNPASNLNTIVSTIVLEEPEANLHPLLQSKLADFFVLTFQYFPYLNLIVETHSEYLIRRLQVLTAHNKISREQIMIHYFNSDENVSVHELKVKKIEIDSDGQLTDTFGPGFFDEATNLKYELMKYNNKSRMN